MGSSQLWRELKKMLKGHCKAYLLLNHASKRHAELVRPAIGHFMPRFQFFIQYLYSPLKNV